MREARSNRRSLWLIIALAVAPVAASYFVYFIWQPERTTNYGELLSPEPLPDPKLTLTDGTPLLLSTLRGKWVLAMIDSASCDARCEKKLLYMRQLQRTQGKEMERIERAWLITDSALPRAAVITAYEGTWLIRAGESGLSRRFPAPVAVADHIYVIDPLGNLMMRYPCDPDPRLMIKDLKRLL